MKSRIAIGLGLCAVAALAIYGTWLYVLGAATDTFASDTLKVKQAYFEGVDGTGSTVQAFQSLVEAIDEPSQERFGRFAADMMAKNPAVVGVTYYRFLRQDQRADFEAKMQELGLGTSLVEGGTAAEPTVKNAADRDHYLVVADVDAAAKPAAYFGWDVLSDASRQATVAKVFATGETLASPDFLLDSGHIATEIFAPVRDVAAASPDTAAMQGMIGLTIDLTKNLGDERWQSSMAIFMTSTLAGETVAKDLYRHIDKDPEGWPVLATLESGFTVEKFGQKLGLKFERKIYPSRVRLSLVALACLGALLIAVLTFYLALLYERLKASLSELAEANRTLEERVLARTSELAQAHREIKEILDNIDEIVLPVGVSREIGASFSRATSRLLGHDITAGDLVDQVLFKNLDPQDEVHARHLFVLQLLGSMDEFQWSLSETELLPTIVYQSAPDAAARTFALRYSPVFVHDKLTRLIVVAADITEIMALRASLAAKDEEHGLDAVAFTEIVAIDPAGPRAFFAESAVRLERIAAAADGPGAGMINLLFRELHTLKGSSRTMGFKALARLAHSAEDLLEGLRGVEELASSEMKGSAEMKGFRAALAALNQGFQAYRGVFGLLHGAKPAAAGAAESTFDQFERLMREERNPRGGVLRWFAEARHERVFSLTQLYIGFAQPMQEIAQTLQKEVVLLPPASDLFLRKELQADLREAFTHALRNAIDHGIEPLAERTAKGKKPQGVLALAVQTNTDRSMTIELIDDGRGVDLARVYALAAKKGLVSKPFAELAAAEVLDLLFAPGLSTKTEVTELSGRGVGLDAVRAALARHEVSCEISQNKAGGSRFSLRLPAKLVAYSVSDDALLKSAA